MITEEDGETFVYEPQLIVPTNGSAPIVDMVPIPVTNSTYHNYTRISEPNYINWQNATNGTYSNQTAMYFRYVRQFI